MLRANEDVDGRDKPGHDEVVRLARSATRRRVLTYKLLIRGPGLAFGAPPVPLSSRRAMSSS